MNKAVFTPLFVDLNPFLTKKSIEIHFYFHHMQYYKNLIALTSEPLETLRDLEEIIQNCKDKKILNNALQIINHNLFWNSISFAGTQQDEEIEKLLEKLNFYQRFRDVANSVFGSGWVWLTFSNGDFHISSTSDAQSHFTDNPLVVLDLWEHAYYVSHTWNRKHYIEEFLKVINFKFIRDQLESFDFSIIEYLAK